MLGSRSRLVPSLCLGDGSASYRRVIPKFRDIPEALIFQGFSGANISRRNRRSATDICNTEWRVSRETQWEEDRPLSTHLCRYPCVAKIPTFAAFGSQDLRDKAGNSSLPCTGRSAGKPTPLTNAYSSE